MTDSASPNKEHNLETTIANRIGAFMYLATGPILSQTFEYPPEDAFNIYSSPLGQKLAALTLSNLPLSADGKTMPKEVVASEAKETAGALEAILSKPIDLDTLLTGFPDYSQARIKENFRIAQEGGLTLEQYFDSFRVFLENVAKEVRITTNITPSLSDQDRMMITFYLHMGWFFGVVATFIVSYGGEGKLRLQSYQRVEYEAVVEYIMYLSDWGGDANKAVKLLRDSLGLEVDRKRRRKGWKIPGSRYRGMGLRNEPQNDEFEEIVIGLYNGLLWATRRNLLDILPHVRTGKLRGSLKLVAERKLKSTIRKANKQLGIKVPPDKNEWTAEGKTEDGIRKRTNQDLEDLNPKEVPDFEVMGKDDEESTSILKLASDKEAFKQHLEDEAEENRQALIKEKVNLYKEKAKLTDRLKLVARLYDKDDDTIAVRLEEAFGKPVTPEAVRALRHDLLEAIRNVITEK